jgi:peptide/nickel transport system substrate-binding protein
MKRVVSILLVLLMAAAVIITGCGEPEPAPPETPAAPPAPAPGEPQYGGILRCAHTFGPRVLGYFPQMGFTDMATAWYYAEGLLNVDGKGNLVPELAESWDVDVDNKTITWHLRQGVKFHDGTDWNADAAKWTYDKTIEAGMLQNSELIKSIEVIDDYTLRFNLTQYCNRLLLAYGYMVFCFSPTATEANGKAWARTNAVGTGPFKLVDFKRDAYMKLEKNENYWRPGRPYLDGIDVRFIPEELTGSASLQTGEIDYYQSPTTATMILKLREMGFKDEVSGLTLGFLMPDANNPDSPFANKKVREAVEYALDRETMAKALRLGLAEPAYQMAPPTSAVYDLDYPVRQYDLEKARQLLAEAGYPNGFKTTIFAILMGASSDNAAAVQSALAEVGIEAKVDLADMGRYMTMQAEGWNNGLLMSIIYLPQPNYATTYLASLGPTPTVPAFPSFGRSPEYEALCEEVKSAYDAESERAIVQKMIRQVGEDATAIPFLIDPFRPVMQPYVHPSKDEETGVVRFFLSEWWMEQQ